MGVKEELEALRNQGVTKKNVSKLKDASGLSTPEAEESAIKAEQERIRIANYGKEADKNLKSYNEAKIALQGKSEGIISPTAVKSSMATKAAAAPKTTNSSSTVKASVPAPAPTTAPAAAPASTPASTPAPAPVAVEDKKDEAVATLEDVPNLEEVPDLEEIPAMETAVGSGAVAAPAAPATINRAERKARRMMEKLGMKKCPGISQVVLKMRGGGRGGVFTIAAPDVFEKNGSYVVFGEARQGGGGAGSAQAQQAQAMQQLAALAKSDGGIEMPAGATSAEPSKIEEVQDTPVDETGLEAKDIDLVVTQAGCSRSKAVQALKDNDGDLVNAIMSLTA